jgi:alpha-1,2-mannosyltransferase
MSADPAGGLPTAGGGSARGRLASRYKRPLEAGVFVEMPLLAVVWLAWFVSGHGGGGDFTIFRRAGSAVLSGDSPYVQPTANLLASNDRFVYPTPFALPFVPFSAVPEHVAAVVFLALSVAAVLIAIWLFEVRDRRCFGAAIIGIPVFGAFGVGSIGPFLLLMVALGWRYRDRTVAGVPLAIAAAAKLFLWPLLIWLAVTRRYRALAAAGAALGAIAVVWLVLDPGGMRHYPETLRVLNDVQRWKSYSLQSLLIFLGAPAAASELAVVATALLGVLSIGLLARFQSERVAFGGAVVVALLATPILWLHYLVLLIVPIALFRPRLAPLWFLPVVLWVTPHPEAAGVPWRIGIVLTAALVTAVAGLQSRHHGDSRLAGSPDPAT